MKTNTRNQTTITRARIPLWKRSFDVFVASFVLVMLVPVFVVVGMLIKLTSRGPVFFRHQRYGLAGRPFRMWKFRTMHADVDSGDHRAHVAELLRTGGALTKMDMDDRLIPCGKWLRALAIDELPQLFNVILGDMSLVGPRPDVIPIDEYESWQQRRFEVVPGITGLWQISGKNTTTFESMISLDLDYISSCSLREDVRILALTAVAIASEVRAAFTGSERLCEPQPETPKELKDHSCYVSE